MRAIGLLFVSISVLVLLSGCLGSGEEPGKNATMNASANSSIAQADNLSTNSSDANATQQIIQSPQNDTSIINTDNAPNTGNASGPSAASEPDSVNGTEKYLSLSNDSSEARLAFWNSEYVIVLDDITFRGDGEGPNCGLFSMHRYGSGAKMGQMAICPDQTSIWTSPDGHEFRIRVTNTALGYSKQARWVEIIIYY